MFSAISTFSLASHSGPYAEWPLSTPLLRDGVPTGRDVPGFVIEGQYRWGEHALLINSWDCPFEEAYEFLLLDADHRVVAKTSLGVPYGTYLLHAHWPLHESALRLHFHTADCYTLSIHPPAGWWRRRYQLRLTHHLVPPRDERTQASIAGLREVLAGIAAEHSGSSGSSGTTTAARRPTAA